MTASSDPGVKDEIARVAHAIWEAEGQPEGRDHEHWMRAKRQVENGESGISDSTAAEPSGAAGIGAEELAPQAVPKTAGASIEEPRAEERPESDTSSSGDPESLRDTSAKG